MKNIILLFLISITLCSEAQVVYKNTELGFGAGGANYYGDLNQSQGFASVQYSGSAFFKHNFNNYISLKAVASYGKIAANDKNNKNSFEKARNLNFQNDIFEISGQSEFNFLSYQPGDFDHRWTPYLTLGFGLLRHNPYTYYNNAKYFLQPLGTEGQNTTAFADRKYSNFVPNLITGLGFKFWMKGAMTMGFEAGYRFTNTDYLDDVSTTYVGASNFSVATYPYPSLQLQDRSTEISSTTLGVAGRQRGISSTKDQYLFAQITMSFRLSQYACPK
jgi:Domain of unknown function (DUF6089)